MITKATKVLILPLSPPPPPHYCIQCHQLVISTYLLCLPVAHLSDAPRRWLVVTGDAPPGSLTCFVHSAVTWDLSLKSHPKDN